MESICLLIMAKIHNTHRTIQKRKNLVFTENLLNSKTNQLNKKNKN